MNDNGAGSSTTSAFAQQLEALRRGTPQTGLSPLTTPSESGQVNYDASGAEQPSREKLLKQKASQMWQRQEHEFVLLDNQQKERNIAVTNEKNAIRRQLRAMVQPLENVDQELVISVTGEMVNSGTGVYHGANLAHKRATIETRVALMRNAAEWARRLSQKQQKGAHAQQSEDAITTKQHSDMDKMESSIHNAGAG